MNELTGTYFKALPIGALFFDLEGRFTMKTDTCLTTHGGSFNKQKLNCVLLEDHHKNNAGAMMFCENNEYVWAWKESEKPKRKRMSMANYVDSL